MQNTCRYCTYALINRERNKIARRTDSRFRMHFAIGKARLLIVTMQNFSRDLPRKSDVLCLEKFFIYETYSMKLYRQIEIDLSIDR